MSDTRPYGTIDHDDAECFALKQSATPRPKKFSSNTGEQLAFISGLGRDLSGQKLLFEDNTQAAVTGQPFTAPRKPRKRKKP